MYAKEATRPGNDTARWLNFLDVEKMSPPHRSGFDLWIENEFNNCKNLILFFKYIYS